MPFIEVHYDPDKISMPQKFDLRKFALELSGRLAELLDPKKLSADDVEVVYTEYGSHDKTNGYAVAVTITANKTITRSERLETVVEEMSCWLAGKLSGKMKDSEKEEKVYVWILLVDAGFDEFQV